MARPRLSVRKIEEVLRLHFECRLSTRAIGKSLGLGRSTVSEYVRRARAAGIGWPLPGGIHEVELDRRLFPPPPSPSQPSRPEPDWSEVHRELKRKGVTLSLLWEEYKAASPEGFRYSWFCEGYRDWAGKLDLVMRQPHRAGEKLFVDYAGLTVEVCDPKTGEVREAQIFVAVLGASNYYTYAEATWTQQLPDWIGSHVRAFQSFGGVPEILVPDNLASGVTRAHRYEAVPNATYRDMAAHFGCAIIPARVRRPKDKAKVEAGVLLVERWILAKLRHRKFFSLLELNDEIARALEVLNTLRIPVIVNTHSGDRERYRIGGHGVGLLSERSDAVVQALAAASFLLEGPLRATR